MSALCTCRAAALAMIMGLLGAILIPAGVASAQGGEDPPCANPYLAEPSAGCVPDYAYWDGVLADLADARGQTGEGGSIASVVTYNEIETGGAGTNNVPANAEFLTDFGTGVGENSEVDIAGALAIGDVDYYSFDLVPGDILGASVTSPASVLKLNDPSGGLLIDSIFDTSGLYPAASPLPGGGEAVLAYVIDTAGTYSIAVQGPLGLIPGPYLAELRVFRPELESRVAATQILFVDFDGATIADRTIFGGPTGPGVLDPLSAFLGDWGLAAGDENAVIDAIMATVEENFADVAALGNNGDYATSGIPGAFQIDIRNSRDDVDPWGSPNVSRVVVGGTISQLGITTLGVSQSIDVGNFVPEQQGVALLDLRSSPAPAPDSLNTVPLAPGATMVDLIGIALGNTVAHEAGHVFGNWHVDRWNSTVDVMDKGGTAAALKPSLGPDGIFGNADDIDRDFGTDDYSFEEAFLGTENTLNAIAFGLATPVPTPTCPVAVSTEAALYDCMAAYDAAGSATTTTVSLVADLALTQALPALNNDSTAIFDLAGNGHTIDGGDIVPTVLRQLDGTSNLTDVTLTGGTSQGLEATGGSTTITTSTVVDNYSGVVIDGAVVAIDNSTIAANATTGIDLVGGSATVRSSTIVDSGTQGLTGSASISGSIIARSGTADCSGLLGAGDLGENIFEDNSCNSSSTAGLAGSLGAAIDPNGCTTPCTETIALLPESPAFNVGGSCAFSTDQRGLVRAVGSCDAGSFEFQDTVGPTVDIASPIDSATFMRNAVVLADFGCSDQPGGAGLATCIGDVEHGSPLDTSTAGSFTFTVTAIDLVGNPTSVTVDYSVAADAFCKGELVTINMNILGVSGVGTTGDDVILGTSGNDVIEGLSGDDLICGKAGADEIYGGGGEDEIYGGSGADEIYGGGGADEIYGGGAGDYIEGGSGSDEIDGGGGSDEIYGQAGSDEISGGAGADEIHGQGSPDSIDGGKGDDVINGQAGADELYGGAGEDTIKGHTGPDTIYGDGDNDTLGGGDGNDVLFGGGGGNDKCSGNTGNGDQAEAATCEKMPGIESTF